MILTIDRGGKRAVSNLNTEGAPTIGSFSFEATPLSVSIADRIPTPATPRFFTPLPLTGWTIRAAIGKAFQIPTAGTFTATYTAADLSTETTEALDVGATALQFQAALNALAKITAVGGVTVTGSGGYFFIRFNDPATQGQITGTATNLAPLSFIEVGTLIDGSGDKREIQTFRLLQQPAAYAVLGTLSAAASATVEPLTVGGGGLNHKVRVKLLPSPYGGKWSLSVGGMECALQSQDVSEADLKAALEAVQITSGALVVGRKYKILTAAAGDDFTNVGAATNEDGVLFVASGTTPTAWTNGSAVTSIGAGNVSASREAEGSYVIGFQGEMSNQDMGTIAADGSLLLAQQFASGVLSTNTSAMELLLGTQPFVDCIFEIEATPPAGLPEKIFRTIVRVEAPLMHGTNLAGPSIYFYTREEIDAKLAAIIDGAGNVLVGTRARFVPLATGFRIEVSTNGVDWTAVQSYEG